jgi:hypothetical protein
VRLTDFYYAYHLLFLVTNTMDILSEVITLINELIFHVGFAFSFVRVLVTIKLRQGSTVSIKSVLE